MLVEIADGGTWSCEVESGRLECIFASISTLAERVTFSVVIDGDLHDRVNTSVPHSWWPPGVLFPVLDAGQTVELRAEGGAIDVRLDLLAHEA